VTFAEDEVPVYRHGGLRPGALAEDDVAVDGDSVLDRFTRLDHDRLAAGDPVVRTGGDHTVLAGEGRRGGKQGSGEQERTDHGPPPEGGSLKTLDTWGRLPQTGGRSGMRTARDLRCLRFCAETARCLYLATGAR